MSKQTQNTVHDRIIPRIWQLSTSIWGEISSIKMRFAQWHTPTKIKLFFDKIYTSEKSTITMVYISNLPSEYTRIKYKRQRTRYVILHMFS